MRALNRAVVVGTMVAVAWAAAGCTDSDDTGPEPTPSPTGTPRAGDVLWRAADLPGEVYDVAAVDDGFVVTTSKATIGYDADGAQQWITEEPQESRPEISGDVVVRYTTPPNDARDRDDMPRIRVLDARSGNLLWQADAYRVLSTPAAIYSTTCTGDSTGQPGDCTITARDSTSGKTRWTAQTYAKASLPDVQKSGVIVTSFPHGTDRTKDPYAKKLMVQTLDPRTGEQIDPDRLVDSVTRVNDILIEQSFQKSSGTACRVDVSAHAIDGDELWRRTFDWTLSTSDQKKGWDCGLGTDLSVLDDTSVDLTAHDGFGYKLDATTGKIAWDHGPDLTVISTVTGVDVAYSTQDRAHQVLDARTHAVAWRLDPGTELRDPVNEPAGYLTVQGKNSDGQIYNVLRSAASGKESLRVEGAIVGTGEDWAATTGAVRGSAARQVVVVAWPH